MKQEFAGCLDGMQATPKFIPDRSLAPTRRSQHLNATYRNIVAGNMLHAFGHPVATCRDIYVLLAQAGPFSNFSQQHTTCRDATRRNTVAKGAQHFAAMLHWNVAIVWLGVTYIMV